MFNAIRNTLRKFIGGDKPAVDRRKLVAEWQERLAALRASYDAARSSDEYRRIWENADRFDADSAHDKNTRHTLVSRSRYEIGSNGYSDGIAQTYSTDLVGTGPSLRMQTGSEGFNRMVEVEWFRWTKAIQFRRKLWCMAHAKHSDGEAFAVLRRNPRVRHRIPLDLRLYEAEQVSTPYLPFAEPGYIDGIKFDEFGNPVWYDLLTKHPGDNNRMTLDFEPERIPAGFVLHWFKMRRPGQHRAVPECSSTLNVGAAARRWREATLAAAETAADFTLFLKTQLPQDSEEMQYATDFSTQEITKRMMTALPIGYEPEQMEAKHPTNNYELLHKQLINEMGRPKNMPYNKAACDSSSYNYASGRLDHQTYYAALDVERADCDELVLSPLFLTWFDLAIARFGWLGGNPDAISDGAREHLWDWPKHRVADVEAEANANETKLKSGQVFHHQLATDAGMDFEDEIEKAATAYGVTTDELRKRLLDVTLPKEQVKAPPRSIPSDDAVAALAAKLNGRNGHAVTN